MELQTPGPKCYLAGWGIPTHTHTHTNTQPSAECNLEPLPIFLSPSPAQKRSCCFSGDKRHGQEMSALMPASQPPLPVAPSLLARLPSEFQPREPTGRPLGLSEKPGPSVWRPAASLSSQGFPRLCPPPPQSPLSSPNETPLAEAASARLDEQVYGCFGQGCKCY